MGALIGITGYAGSGKDTIGDWFVSRRHAHQYSFALPIKVGICAAFSLPFDVFVDRRLKEMPIEGIGKSPRELAQTLGTEWGRTHVGNDIWVIAAERKLKQLGHWGDGLTVITDVRFENEAAWIRKHGSLIHVTRPGANGSVGVHNHASEAGILPVAGDIALLNGGSIQDLYLKLEQAFPFAMEQAVN